LITAIADAGERATMTVAVSTLVLRCALGLRCAKNSTWSVTRIIAMKHAVQVHKRTKVPMMLTVTA